MVPILSSYSFSRYLQAKKTVDDRALNARVWTYLADFLTARKTVSILEAGAGIGTMLQRLIEHRLFLSGTYTAVDVDPESIRIARAALPAWAATQGISAQEHEPGMFTLAAGGMHLQITFLAGDILAFLPGIQAAGWDVVIAHAFLDLIDLPTALPKFLGSLFPEGAYYFSLNYDGLTVLEPPLDPDLDSHILFLYHQSMDNRLVSGRPSGSSRTGRNLFAALRAADGEILSAGSSDWVVFAGPAGYPDDEAYFLHFIIHTIDQELTGHPDLDPIRFAHWVKSRHEQIDRGELVYLAHQVDIFGRKA